MGVTSDNSVSWKEGAGALRDGARTKRELRPRRKRMATKMELKKENGRAEEVDARSQEERF